MKCESFLNAVHSDVELFTRSQNFRPRAYNLLDSFGAVVRHFPAASSSRATASLSSVVLSAVSSANLRSHTARVQAELLDFVRNRSKNGGFIPRIVSCPSIVNDTLTSTTPITNLKKTKKDNNKKDEVLVMLDNFEPDFLVGRS